MRAAQAATSARSRTAIVHRGVRSHKPCDGVSDAVPDWQRCDPVAIDPVQYKAWCDDKLAGLRGDAHERHPAPATGAVQRKGASARELAGTAVEMTTSSPRVLALEAAIAVLEDAEADAQHLMRKVASGAISHDRAYGKLVPIIHAMLAHKHETVALLSLAELDDVADALIAGGEGHWTP